MIARLTHRRFWWILVGSATAALSACAGANRDVLQRAQQATEAGRFAEAERLLRPHVANAEAPVADEYAVALEVMRRIRLDFPLTSKQLLEKLRARIPDATAEDVQRWTASGALQHRVIDGEVRYFKQAVGNLMRFAPDARARQPQSAPTAGAFSLVDHLARLVDLAETSGKSEVFPVRHHVRYELRVKDGHPRVKPGAKVRCWLPFPQDYRQQGDIRLVAIDPPDAMIAPSGTPQRTIYFEQTVGDPPQPPCFVAEFEFTTRAYVPKLDPAQVQPYDTAGAVYREFTAERPPHIVFTPEVRRLAAEIVGDETHPLERARRVFRWVSERIPWSSEMEYSIIPNISAKGLAARTGDCGVQGLVFVTLCRAAGVPARWQSGWQLLPADSNMHDWSEFYLEPWGWLPADASYGVQKHADPRVQDFYCGHMDPYRMIVNLDYGRALHPAKTSFRSEPADFQRGEIEIDGHNLYYDEWTYDFDVRTTPLDSGLAALEETFDALVPELLAEGHIPGAVLAVGRKTDRGYETWQKAYGFLCSEPRRETMPADAIFDLASMSKPIGTGTSLLLLIQRGDVQLDDPVGKYLPEFNEGNKKDVTVRHLMTHMSGMPPYVGAGEQAKIKEKAGFPCPAEMRAYIRALPLARPAGEAVVYSCLNAILCAEIVEKVSGEPLDQFAQKNVFGPLGLKDTGYNPPETLRGRIMPTTKTDYGVGAGGFLQGQVHDPLAAMQGGVSGNAGVFSSAGDLERFAQMVLNGGELDGVRILSAQTVQDMSRIQNPDAKNANGQPDRRGLLWDLYVPDAKDKGVDALSSFGHTGYTGTAMRFYPEQGVYVIALTNRVHPDDTGKVGEFRERVWKAVGDTLLGVRSK